MSEVVLTMTCEITKKATLQTYEIVNVSAFQSSQLHNYNQASTGYNASSCLAGASQCTTHVN